MPLMKWVLIRAWTSIHFGGSNAQILFWLGLVRLAMNIKPDLVGRAADDLHDGFTRRGARP